MTAPRDIDLPGWLNGIAHHPPADEETVLAHQAARNLVGQLGMSFFQLLPPGREKSLAFTHLEEALMWANKAIAVHGGPEHFTDDIRRVAGAVMEPEVPGWPDPAGGQRIDPAALLPEQREASDRRAPDFEVSVTSDPRDNYRLRAYAEGKPDDPRVGVTVEVLDLEVAREAIGEAERAGENFLGFHVLFHDVDTLNYALNGIAKAGSVAFMGDTAA